MYRLIWDEAYSTSVPSKLGKAMCDLTTPTWPHTFVIPKYASMVEYKQYAPANHFHMTWDLPVSHLQYWMDLTGVISATSWAVRPSIVKGTDRPLPLIYHLNGGETTCVISEPIEEPRVFSNFLSSVLGLPLFLVPVVMRVYHTHQLRPRYHCDRITPLSGSPSEPTCHKSSLPCFSA